MKTWNIPPIPTQWKGVIAQYKYVLLVISLGMVFLLFPTEEKVTVSAEREGFNLASFEEHLAENLALIQGAGTTNVVLTLKNDGEKIYAQDSQKEAQGKTSSTTVTVGSGSNEQVVEVQENYPQFQGALVICEGGDLASVQLKLIQAVSALTGLGSDSITICKRDM